MKKLYRNNKGIGLIEVMVTTVVVALGLLSVASLQGELVGGSRDNKTKAECQVLANAKIEQLRDTIDETGTPGAVDNSFASLVSSIAGEPISGVTEDFTRSWVVTDDPDPTLKQKTVTVSVSWGNGADQACLVQSVIAYNKIGNSALAAASADNAGPNLGGPSTNAESSDEISEHINLPSALTPGTLYTDADGKKYIVEESGEKGTLTAICSSYSPALTIFENGLYTRRVDFDNDVNAVAVKEAIELYDVANIGGSDYCTPRVRFNGGVIIPIRGIVHSGATTGNGGNVSLLDVNLFTFNTSESGTYCVFNPPVDAKSAPYVCYVGGSCEYGPDGLHAPDGSAVTTGGDTIVTECPETAVAAEKVGPGGWRGKVGLLGVAASGRNVCFGEEITSAPDSLDTARNYFTRNGDNGLNEGINKPYNCHDFLIIDGLSTERLIHNECVTRASEIAGLTLASKTIQRNIPVDNVFDPSIGGSSYCGTSVGTSYTITGAVANTSSPATIVISDSVITENCTATTTTYTCNITTEANSVNISGEYNLETVSCDLSPISASGCGLAFTATNDPTYTITGNITGTSSAANAVTVGLSDGGVCRNNNDGTYQCAITTALTSVEMTATIVTGGTVATTPQTISLSSGTLSMTGPDFAADMASTYIVSGLIDIGSGVEISSSPVRPIAITVALATGTGTCDLNGAVVASTVISYRCITSAGDNTLSFTISPWCSTDGGRAKKYSLSSSGETTTSGAGSLVIDLGYVGGNVNKDIAIVKSNTNC